VVHDTDSRPDLKSRAIVATLALVAGAVTVTLLYGLALTVLFSGLPLLFIWVLSGALFVAAASTVVAARRHG
jgi:hypothetical protein